MNDSLWREERHYDSKCNLLDPSSNRLIEILINCTSSPGIAVRRRCRRKGTHGARIILGFVFVAQVARATEKPDVTDGRCNPTIIIPNIPYPVVAVLFYLASPLCEELFPNCIGHRLSTLRKARLVVMGSGQQSVNTKSPESDRSSTKYSRKDTHQRLCKMKRHEVAFILRRNCCQ